MVRQAVHQHPNPATSAQSVYHEQSSRKAGGLRASEELKCSLAKKARWCGIEWVGQGASDGIPEAEYYQVGKMTKGRPFKEFGAILTRHFPGTVRHQWLS